MAMTIQIDILASGSTGNAYRISEGNRSILIDPGVPYQQLQRLSGHKLSQIDSVLVSHEHADHCRSVHDLARTGVEIALSRGTLDALGGRNGSIFKLISAEKEADLMMGWRVLPFATVHDAVEPLGFLILSPAGEKILYASDTCYIRHRFTGVNHFIIEANHSEELLQQNDRLPESLKNRIRMSHFEIKRVIEFYRAQDLSAARSIHAIHISEQNGNADLFASEIERVTGLPVY